MNFVIIMRVTIIVFCVAIILALYPGNDRNVKVKIDNQEIFCVETSKDYIDCDVWK